MIGNGTSDLVPKTTNIPSVIINHGDKPCSKSVLNRGIIIRDFLEIMDPNFYPEISKTRTLHK